MRTTLAAMLAGTVVVASLAACSSSGGASPGTGSGSGSSTVGTSRTATAPTSAKPPSAAALKQALLAAGDLPSGFQASAAGPASTPQDRRSQAALVRCVHGHNTAQDKVATAQSDDYTQGNLHIGSSANSYRRLSDILEDTAILNDAAASRCFQELLGTEVASSLPAGTKLVSTHVVVRPNIDGPKEEVATATGTVVVRTHGRRAPIYLRVAFLTSHLVEAQVQAENVLAPVPAKVFDAAVAKVAGRVGSL